MTDLIAGILVMQRRGGYKDIPGLCYHFPKATYIKALTALQGSLVLFYEPRRGGTSANSGGRMGFTSFAFVTDIWDDPNDPTHAFAGLRYFQEFLSVVPLRITSVSSQSLQRAVREIDYAEAQAVVEAGLFAGLALDQPRVGLTDLNALANPEEREVRRIVTNVAIRDATFRYRVVEQTYAGRCALTGLRLTNGLGRAEVDAAHIRPVAADGPDSIRNGIALTKSVHWAFDRGLLSIGDDGTILKVDRGADDLTKLLNATGRAILPVDEASRPHVAFLSWHRSNVFKGESPMVSSF
jgi:putative restriction endonuclease